MNEQSQINECWMKLGDAAFALGVSEITLRRKVKCGRLPHEFRDGKYYVLLHHDTRTGTYFESLHPELARPSLELRRAPGDVAERRIPAEAPGLAQQAESSNARIHALQESLDEREQTIRSLRRTVEDQQTLIVFLEQTIADLAERREAARHARGGASRATSGLKRGTAAPTRG